MYHRLFHHALKSDSDGINTGGRWSSLCILLVLVEPNCLMLINDLWDISLPTREPHMDMDII